MQITVQEKSIRVS